MLCTAKCSPQLDGSDIRIHHPLDKDLGSFNYGRKINMKLNKFRKIQFIVKYRIIAAVLVLERLKRKISKMILSERGDVPGWVLVVLMTTGLVTAIWTIASPRLSAILRNSLDAMNNIK